MDCWNNSAPWKIKSPTPGTVWYRFAEATRNVTLNLTQPQSPWVASYIFFMDQQQAYCPYLHVNHLNYAFIFLNYYSGHSMKYQGVYEHSLVYLILVTRHMAAILRSHPVKSSLSSSRSLILINGKLWNFLIIFGQLKQKGFV